MMSYAFILPVLSDIYQGFNTENPMESVKLIVTRIVASGVVLIVGAALTSLIQKIISKFSQD